MATPTLQEVLRQVPELGQEIDSMNELAPRIRKELLALPLPRVDLPP